MAFGGVGVRERQGVAEIGGEWGRDCGAVMLQLCTVQQVCVLRDQPNNCQLTDWDGFNP